MTGLPTIHAYHLIPAEASKARAVARHMQARGYEPSQCIAVGDSREDLEVSSVVGTFWLVANALTRDPVLGGEVAGRAGVRLAADAYGAGVYEAVVTTLAEGERLAPSGAADRLEFRLTLTLARALAGDRTFGDPLPRLRGGVNVLCLGGIEDGPSQSLNEVHGEPLALEIRGVDALAERHRPLVVVRSHDDLRHAFSFRSLPR